MSFLFFGRVRVLFRMSFDYRIKAGTTWKGRSSWSAAYGSLCTVVVIVMVLALAVVSCSCF